MLWCLYNVSKVDKMRKRKTWFDNPSLELSDIFRDYALRGNKTKAIRRLNIQSYNYSKKDRKQWAKFFKNIKRDFEGVRL